MSETNEDVVVKESRIEGKGVFANRDFKKGEIVVNDHKFFFDSRDNVYERSLDNFVEPNFNAIHIIPKSSMNIVQLEVKLKER